MKGIIIKAFSITYRPICGGDDLQILVIARNLTQALNTVEVEIADMRNQIIGISMVEGKVIFAADCQAPTP